MSLLLPKWQPYRKNERLHAFGLLLYRLYFTSLLYAACHLHKCARKEVSAHGLLKLSVDLLVTLNWLCFSALATWGARAHNSCLWSTPANLKVETWTWFPSAASHYKHVQLFKKRQTAAFRAQSPQEHRPNSHSTPQSDAEYRGRKTLSVKDSLASARSLTPASLPPSRAHAHAQQGARGDRMIHFKLTSTSGATWIQRWTWQLIIQCERTLVQVYSDTQSHTNNWLKERITLVSTASSTPRSSISPP